MHSALGSVAFNKALKEKERVLLIIQTLGAAVPNAAEIYGRPNPGGCYGSMEKTNVWFVLRFGALLLLEDIWSFVMVRLSFCAKGQMFRPVAK